jgi:pimeloyl-ACP methyl ester carboxylesterase
MTLLLIAIGTLVAIFAAGFVVEALRQRPAAPDKLYWAPDLPIQYTEIDGNRIRYIKTGGGPNLVLLHTLRTRLDLFEKIVPTLAKSFTVYALDYPGHGFSDIPQAEYSPDVFVNAVEGFLHKFDLKDVTLAGVSIGGVIALIIAAKGNPRVTKVVSINPYDYGNGTGLARANAFAWLTVNLGKVPVLGEAFMRLRTAYVEGRILRGGVADPSAITAGFGEQANASGRRPGHYQAFLNLLRHAYLWDEARLRYGDIKVPVLVVYGDRDWSHIDERQRTVATIPNAKMETIPEAGHFLSLDQPKRLTDLIKAFA